MKIKYVEVSDLIERPGKISFELNHDLNILTGRNGAGKTSLLKLIWYVMSGNLILALNEVKFSKIRIITDLYDCTVIRTGSSTCSVDLFASGRRSLYEDIRDEDGDIVINAEDEANPRLMGLGQSVFLPTFRRIEGGFTLTRAGRPMIGRGLSSITASRSKSDIEEGLISLSRKLTNQKHTFVASISTVDVVSLLLTKFADLSEEYNELQRRASEDIIKRIKDFKADDGIEDEIGTANSVLDKIRADIEAMEGTRENVMAPFDVVRDIVKTLFQHTGIQIGSRLNFGDAAKAVNSDALSAGEKQMLSFICYNVFNYDTPFFIDEPELSLHVDWQRQLFPTLLSQKTSNQFIIATHSPFIYSKYPDKEIPIDLDRGDEGFSE